MDVCRSFCHYDKCEKDTCCPLQWCMVYIHDWRNAPLTWVHFEEIRLSRARLGRKPGPDIGECCSWNISMFYVYTSHDSTAIPVPGSRKGWGDSSLQRPLGECQYFLFNTVVTCALIIILYVCGDGRSSVPTCRSNESWSFISKTDLDTDRCLM